MEDLGGLKILFSILLVKVQIIIQDYESMILTTNYYFWTLTKVFTVGGSLIRQINEIEQPR